MNPLAQSDRVARVIAKTHQPNGPDGCWIFTGRITKKGYGDINVQGRHVKAHRFVYEHFNGPIPAGLVSDHLCRNRACVNPAHIEPVTNAENIRRGAGWGGVLHPEYEEIQRRRREKPTRKAAATPGMCPAGHALTDDNVKIRNDRGRQYRLCLTCHRASKAAEKRRMRAVRAELRKSGQLPTYDLGPLEPGDLRHGTLAGYIRHRCDCQPCGAAHARHQGGRRERS